MAVQTEMRSKCKVYHGYKGFSKEKNVEYQPPKFVLIIGCNDKCLDTLELNVLLK